MSKALFPPEEVVFDLNDTIEAINWKFNCGPAALCGVLGLTPEELRPFLGDFEKKGYMSPTMMFSTLGRLKVNYKRIFTTVEEKSPGKTDQYPVYGLMRIQWGGPWTNPGVPIRARYRHTHWIGFDINRDSAFDVNAMCVGGWVHFDEWSDQLVPWLLGELKGKHNGRWWVTHAIEVDDFRKEALFN